MEIMKKIQGKPEDSWITTLVSLLPLWLLALVILAIVLRQPPFLEGFAIFAVVLILAISLAFVWKEWLEIDLFIYSLFPFFSFSSSAKCTSPIDCLSSCFVYFS